MKCHGIQCGFCSPGMVMSLYALLRNNPHPSELQIEQAVQGITDQLSLLSAYHVCDSFACVPNSCKTMLSEYMAYVIYLSSYSFHSVLACFALLWLDAFCWVTGSAFSLYKVLLHTVPWRVLEDAALSPSAPARGSRIML